MDGVEKLVQMNEVERMREVMDIISDSLRKQNDTDRMEMLAMLASATAMETNLMSVQFAHSADKQAAGTKTKKQGKALMKGVEQAENGKDKEVEATSKTQPSNQSPQKQQQPNQPPANTLATRTQQAMNKKKRFTGRDTLAPVGTFGTV
jgi:Tfp pilus assembly protein FimT